VATELYRDHGCRTQLPKVGGSAVDRLTGFVADNAGIVDKYNLSKNRSHDPLLPARFLAMRPTLW
jgi:hypothetical protein